MQSEGRQVDLQEHEVHGANAKKITHRVALPFISAASFVKRVFREQNNLSKYSQRELREDSVNRELCPRWHRRVPRES